jgi:hypothetical protein
MALSSSSTFNVQIDSHYRDMDKYPTVTDFGVKFLNTNTGTSLNGYPSYRGAVKIDPDYLDASFKVVNGSLQNLKRMSDGSIYVSGLIDELQIGGEFQILQNTYTVFSLSTNLLTSPFIAKFVPIGTSYYVSFFNYLTPVSLPFDSRLNPTRSIFDIDINGNIYWVFDCSYLQVNVTSIKTSSSVLYTIKPQDQTRLRQYITVCAFDSSGYQYVINGQPWGYHIFYSNKDLITTLQNGKFGIKSNTALNLFLNMNNNPYDPYVYKNDYALTDICLPFIGTINVSGTVRMIVPIRDESYDHYLYVYSLVPNKVEQTLVNTISISLPESFGLSKASYIEYNNKIYIMFLTYRLYLFEYDVTTNSITNSFQQILGRTSSGTPTGQITIGFVTTIGRGEGAGYMFLATWNSVSPAYPGLLLYKLDLTNVSGQFQLITRVSTVGTDFLFQNAALYNYDKYLVCMNSNYGITLTSYNLELGALSASNLITSVGSDSLTNIFQGIGVLWEQPTLNAFAFTSYGLYFGKFGGWIFAIADPGAEISFVSRVPTIDYTYYEPSIYTESGKYYIVCSKGRILDISNLKYPYEITTEYPTIPDNTDSIVGSVANGILSCIYNAPDSNSYQVVTSEFITSTTSLESSQYTKPISDIQIYRDPSGNVVSNNTIHYEIFTIPGNSTTVNTNFSPSQFISNGLLAWYKPTEVSNITLSGSNVTSIKDLSGNGLDLIASTGSRAPTWSSTGYVTWTPSLNRDSRFSTYGVSSPIKFVIMSFSLSSGTSNVPINIFKTQTIDNMNTLSLDINATPSSLLGNSSILYNDYETLKSPTGGYIGSGISIGTYFTLPWYFGSNISDNQYPFLNGLASPSYSSTPYNAAEYITIMNNLREYNGVINLKECIVLDFVPNTYQLSLFQSYLNSSVETFPSEIPSLAGVYSVKYDSLFPNRLSFNVVDGSAIPYNSYLEDLSYSYYTPISVNYVRNSTLTDGPNIFAVLHSGDILQVYRANDYLNQRSVCRIDTSFSKGYPYIVTPYISGYDTTNIIVTNYDYTQDSRIVKIYRVLQSEEIGTNDTIELTQTYSISNPYAFTTYIYFQDVYTYTNRNTYLFLLLGTKAFDNGASLYGVLLQVYDITSPVSMTLVAQVPYTPTSSYTYGTPNKNSGNIVRAEDGTIYLIYINNPGGFQSVIFNITDPFLPLRSPSVDAGYNGRYILDGSNVNASLIGNNVGSSCFVHPLTNKIYSLQMNNNLYTGAWSTYLTYKDYTNLNSVPGSTLINLNFYKDGNSYDYSSFFVPDIRCAVWNQKVWGMFMLYSTGTTNIQSATSSATFFLDISSPEYAFQNYRNDNSISTILSTTTYTGVSGIGTSIITKLNNYGSSDWLSYIGGDGTSGNNMWSINVVSSNIEIDDTLRNLYVAGSWMNKIQNYTSNRLLMNQIISSITDISVNSYVLKMNVNTGEFVWTTPTFGSNDDYFERLQYISTTYKGIGVVSHFSSPAMLIYEPQTSKSGGSFVNPINTILNIGNSSTVTSAIFVINESGVLQWYSKLYSTEQNRDTYLYDLSVDGGQINCIGFSNANILRCTDSTLKNVQNTYSEIDPITQRYVIVYSYDLNGNYLKSQKVEFDTNINISVQDIKTFSSLNRIVFFANCRSSSLGQYIYPYNKDGTIASTVGEVDANKNLTYIFTYKYDSSFTDTNGKKYSQVKMNTLTSQDFTNYKMFIQGGVQVTDLNNITSTYLNTETILNNNFSIRSSTGSGTGAMITLNSLVDTSKIVRYNLPINNDYWKGSISATSLFGSFSFNTGASTSSLTVSEFFCNTPSIISSTGTYFIFYAVTGGSFYRIPVSSISLYRNIYTINLTEPITNTITPGFAYLTTVNKNADYTLQFYPGSLTAPVYFNVVLNSITIPNRPVKSYDYSGVRYLSDFPYIYLAIINADDDDVIDANIFNNFYTNNIDKTKAAIFTLPSTTLVGGSNFAVLTTSYIPKLKFSPGFYNIRVQLYDPDGNIILYDNTPTLTSDSSFTGGTVPDKLMRIILSLTLKSA